MTFPTDDGSGPAEPGYQVLPTPAPTARTLPAAVDENGNPVALVIPTPGHTGVHAGGVPAGDVAADIVIDRGDWTQELTRRRGQIQGRASKVMFAIVGVLLVGPFLLLLILLVRALSAAAH